MNYKVENLELLNDRFNRHLPRTEAVYDSRRSRSDLYTSLNVSNRMGEIPFLTTKERFIEKDEITTSSSEANSITINSKGNIIDMKTKLALPNKLLQFNSDKGRKISSETRQQYSFGSNRLNKTLYDDDVEVLTIDKRLKLGTVNSPKWSLVPKDTKEYSNPNTGPGYYECYDDHSKSPHAIINDIPRFDDQEDYISLSHEDNQSEYSSLSSLGAPKWNSVNRWNHPLYRKEPYVKTSGMRLSPNFDKAMDKRIMFDFTKMAKRDLDKLPKADPGSDVNPDYGSKITMQTQSRTSVIKYAAAFKSKIPSGMKIVHATSGVNIGPGTLQLPPAIVVKDPHKVSYYMLRGRTGFEPPDDGKEEKKASNSPSKASAPKPKVPEPEVPFMQRPLSQPNSRPTSMEYNNREQLRNKIQEERTKHGKWTQCAL